MCATSPKVSCFFNTKIKHYVRLLVTSPRVTRGVLQKGSASVPYTKDRLLTDVKSAVVFFVEICSALGDLIYLSKAERVIYCRAAKNI